jgi:hypothetical protein
MSKWLAVILWALSAFTVFSQTIVWKGKAGAGFIVHFHSGDETNVAELIQRIEKALPELQDQLGSTLTQPARIYLASSQGEFDQITHGQLPSWSQGVSYPESGAIVLKSPQFSHDIAIFQTTAIHELAHLLIAVKAGTAVPRWLTEGLALMLSGEGPGKPLLPISRALWASKLLSLEDVENVDSYSHNEAELAYVESYNAVEFLIKCYGWETLRRILGDMGAGHSWNDALSAQTGLDQAGFEADWRTNLQKSYRWMILLDAQTLVFGGMTALVLIVGVMAWQRRRRIYRQWEADGENEIL